MSAVKNFDLSVPALPDDFERSNLSVAAAALPSTSNPLVYSIDLKRDWCMGLIPHGGYLLAVIANAVRTHFECRHTARSQMDFVTIHVEYIAKTMIGAADIHITELNFGRQFSTVRVQLYQYPNHDRSTEPRLCMEALLRQGNLSREMAVGGVTVPTNPIVRVTDIPKRSDCVEKRDAPPLFARRTAYAKVVILLAKDADECGQSKRLGPGVTEQWVTWRRDDRHKGESGFDITSLAFLSDAFFPLPETYGLSGDWYPTLSCGLEVKKAPPTEMGWEWLFMRVEAHQIRHGRMDINVTILDEQGELVALSRHTALIMGSERILKTKGTEKL